jgi:hypothetical protein
MTLHSSMLLALRTVRDGGKPTRAERYWLRDAGYINSDGTLTMSGHNELNNDDNQKEDNRNGQR